jgi:hypothetical protein
MPTIRASFGMLGIGEEEGKRRRATYVPAFVSLRMTGGGNFGGFWICGEVVMSG